MDSMELTVCDNVLEGGEQRDNSSSSTSSPESDKVARQPNRRRDQKRDVEIRPQSVEEEEEGGDPGGFRVHPSTSRVYNRRLRWILLAVLSAAVVMLALTVNLLHEKWLEAITERVAQVLFGCGPDETGTVGDVTKDECFGLRLSVEDNLKLLFAATMVISLVGVVINAATLTTVCRNQHEKSLHDAWVFFMYFCTALCVLTLVLLPVASFLWIAVRTMRKYRDAIKEEKEKEGDGQSERQS